MVVTGPVGEQDRAVLGFEDVFDDATQFEECASMGYAGDVAQL